MLGTVGPVALEVASPHLASGGWSLLCLPGMGQVAAAWLPRALKLPTLAICRSWGSAAAPQSPS